MIECMTLDEVMTGDQEDDGDTRELLEHAAHLIGCSLEDIRVANRLNDDVANAVCAELNEHGKKIGSLKQEDKVGLDIYSLSFGRVALTDDAVAVLYHVRDRELLTKFGMESI